MKLAIATNVAWKFSRARLAQAQDELSSLNEPGRGKEHFREIKILEQAALAILEKHKLKV